MSTLTDKLLTKAKKLSNSIHNFNRDEAYWYWYSNFFDKVPSAMDRTHPNTINQHQLFTFYWFIFKRFNEELIKHSREGVDLRDVLEFYISVLLDDKCLKFFYLQTTTRVILTSTNGATLAFLTLEMLERELNTSIFGFISGLIKLEIKPKIDAIRDKFEQILSNSGNSLITYVKEIIPNQFTLPNNPEMKLNGEFLEGEEIPWLEMNTITEIMQDVLKYIDPIYLNKTLAIHNKWLTEMMKSDFEYNYREFFTDVLKIIDNEAIEPLSEERIQKIEESLKKRKYLKFLTESFVTSFGVEWQVYEIVKDIRGSMYFIENFLSAKEVERLLEISNTLADSNALFYRDVLTVKFEVRIFEDSDDDNDEPILNLDELTELVNGARDLFDIAIYYVRISDDFGPILK